MSRGRKKVCRECGRIYVRLRVRTNPTLGWCGPNCYRKSYFRRRKGKAKGEAPEPVDDSAIHDPQVLEALAHVLREESSQEGAAAWEAKAEETHETGATSIDVVADRALVAQTRLGEDGRMEVEWVGRCWAWLTEGESPSLVDVAVRDGEIVKLLEPGQVRRVRATERTIETPEGEVGGLEVWMEFRGFRAEPEPELRATARGLWEGGKVRIAWRSSRDQPGKIGTLLRFHTGVVEVDGKRFGTGLDSLEPLDSADAPPHLTGESRANGEIEEEDDVVELLLDVVADRALVAQTRFGEDDRVGVEWVGRCWAWLGEVEAPSLMDVVVVDGEVAKLLEPGKVRRVLAIERTIETPEGETDGLELRSELGAEPEPDRRAATRGFWEGGKVRVPPERPWDGEEGKVGTLLRFSAATVEVDGRRFVIGPKDLEPLDGPDGSPTVQGSSS